MKFAPGTIAALLPFAIFYLELATANHENAVVDICVRMHAQREICNKLREAEQEATKEAEKIEFRDLGLRASDRCDALLSKLANSGAIMMVSTSCPEDSIQKGNKEGEATAEIMIKRVLSGSLSGKLLNLAS